MFLLQVRPKQEVQLKVKAFLVRKIELIYMTAFEWLTDHSLDFIVRIFLFVVSTE